MKHVNPDLAPPRPQDPPPYTEAGGRPPRRASAHGSMMETPPPEYRSQEGINRAHLGEPQAEEDGSRRHHHHHHHHRRHHSRHTGPQTPKPAGASSATESLLGEGGRPANLPPHVPYHEGCNPRTTVEAEICAYNLC